TVKLNYDSNIAIMHANNAQYSGKRRPISKNYSMIRELLKGIVSIYEIRLPKNLANPLTKDIASEKIYNTLKGMGLKLIE
ncbi:hypothetical protein PJP07_30550, partial [Mycobacterium kansasii]